MATQVLNQDHMTNPEYFTTAPASFEVTKEKMRTRYAILIIRTEVFDGSDAEDITEINQLQDLIKISHENQGKLEIPKFDETTYQTTKNAVQGNFHRYLTLILEDVLSRSQKQGDLRNSLVLLGVTQL